MRLKALYFFCVKKKQVPFSFLLVVLLQPTNANKLANFIYQLDKKKIQLQNQMCHKLCQNQFACLPFTFFPSTLRIYFHINFATFVSFIYFVLHFHQVNNNLTPQIVGTAMTATDWQQLRSWVKNFLIINSNVIQLLNVDMSNRKATTGIKVVVWKNIIKMDMGRKMMTIKVKQQQAMRKRKIKALNANMSQLLLVTITTMNENKCGAHNKK